MRPLAVTSQDWPSWAGGGPGTGSISIRTPGVGGAIAIGTVWLLAAILIAIDGPAPAGDAAAATLLGRFVFGNTWKGSLGRGLLLIPEYPFMFEFGEAAREHLFPDTTDSGMISFNHMVEENMWVGPGVQFYVR